MLSHVSSNYTAHPMLVCTMPQLRCSILGQGNWVYLGGKDHSV